MPVEAWADTAQRPVNGQGVKARVGHPTTDYSEWRRTVGHGCYATDIDWVEWRVADGVARPVALLETTFYDDIPDWREKLPQYRAAALARFKRDGQGLIVPMLASGLGVRAYLAIIRKDLGQFMVCRLADEAWREMGEPEYRAWIVGLGAPSPPPQGVR